MANTQPNKTIPDIMEALLRLVVAGLTLLALALLAIALSSAAFVILLAVWPTGTYSVDRNVVDLVRVFAWPLAAIIAVFFLASSRTLQQGARSVFQRVSKLKAGSYEVSFSQEGARRLKRDLEESLADFGDQSRTEYTRSVRTHRLKEILDTVLKQMLEISKVIEAPDGDGIREKNVQATVHILDVLYEDSLYQLVGYIPSGGGDGRRFSTRFGAIGTALRSGKNIYWNIKTTELSADRLITHYGMTSAEAARAEEVEYALAMPLRDSKGTTPGVLFVKAAKLSSVTSAMDAVGQNAKLDTLLKAFENDVELKNRLAQLADSVARVFEDVSPSGTFIRIYG